MADLPISSFRKDEAESAAITEMFLKGVSTSKVGAVTEKLMGVSPSASTVSRLCPSTNKWVSA
jgi:transposase-like protein